jgi:hypothetical protein
LLLFDQLRIPQPRQRDWTSPGDWIAGAARAFEKGHARSPRIIPGKV